MANKEIGTLAGLWSLCSVLLKTVLCLGSLGTSRGGRRKWDRKGFSPRTRKVLLLSVPEIEMLHTSLLSKARYWGTIFEHLSFHVAPHFLMLGSAWSSRAPEWHPWTNHTVPGSMQMTSQQERWMRKQAVMPGVWSIMQKDIPGTERKVSKCLWDWERPGRVNWSLKAERRGRGTSFLGRSSGVWKNMVNLEKASCLAIRKANGRAKKKHHVPQNAQPRPS